MGSIRSPMQAAFLAIVFGGLFAFQLSALGQDVLSVRTIETNGSEITRDIPIPFSERDLWNEAIRRALEKEYWGTKRVFVKMTPTTEPVLCRVISDKSITVWFEDFKQGSQAGSSWQQNQIQHQAFVSELLRVSRPPQHFLAFGVCGTDVNPKAVVLMHRRDADYFWLDAADAAPPQLCSIDSRVITAESGAQFKCDAVSDNPRIMRTTLRIGMSSNSMKVGVMKDIVAVRADSDDLVDLCTVNVLSAEPKDENFSFSAGDLVDKLPHPIRSGALQLPGGKKIDKATVGFLTCRIRASNGSFRAGTIVYPNTWIGLEGTRAWVDIDADGRADFCRIVSAIGPNTTSALLMCTSLREGGVHGDTIVDLVDLD